MAFFDAVVDAAAHDETLAGAVARCFCMFGSLFAVIAFFLCLIVTAATGVAPTPTYILEAAIAGMIVGIIVSVAVRSRYHSIAVPHWHHR